MMRIRLIPVVIFGLVSLLTIRVLSLAVENRPAIADASAAPGERFARTIERARLGPPADDSLITGSTAKPGEAKPDEVKSGEAKPGELAPPASAIRPEAEGTRLPPPPAQKPERGQLASPAEREILEKLKERRTEIEARDRELDMRDSLLRNTERKIDDRIGQLRTLESQLESSQQKNSDPKQRFKPLVTMYESMKPKEAARVFDRLELKVLIDIVQQMNPRKMAEILAVMEPAAAEKLTVALARQAANVADAANPNAEGELPRLNPPRR